MRQTPRGAEAIGRLSPSVREVRDRQPDPGAGPRLLPHGPGQPGRHPRSSARRLRPGAQLPPRWPRWAKTAFLLALTAFIALLAIGVLRRWRWTFWGILVAFLAGVLRVPVAILQLSDVLPASVPSWYVVFQGLIGLVQLAIGLVMLAGYRRSGVWGSG